MAGRGHLPLAQMPPYFRLDTITGALLYTQFSIQYCNKSYLTRNVLSGMIPTSKATRTERHTRMYSTSFQCPVTGEWVKAQWARQRDTITIEPREDAKSEETKNWCVRYSYAKEETWEEAGNYISRVSNGQTFGFEKERH